MMPWSEADAAHKTKHADTPAKRAKWARIANAVLEKDGDEGRAIRIANDAMHSKPGLKNLTHAP